MRTGIALGSGVLAFVFALAVEAPATLIDGRLDALSSGRVRLVDTRGTVWDGSAALWVSPGYATAPFAWRLDAWPLAWGELRASIEGKDGGEPRAAIDLSGGRFAVRNVYVTLPADALLRIAGAPEVLAPAGGTLALRSDALTVRREAVDGHVTAQWEGASLPGFRPLDRVALGDVRLEGAGQGNALNATLSNVGGDVDIAGSARLSTDGASRVEAVIRPRPGVDAERSRALAAALSAVGRADGAGGYRIVWSAPQR